MNSPWQEFIGLVMFEKQLSVLRISSEPRKTLSLRRQRILPKPVVFL